MKLGILKFYQILSVLTCEESLRASGMNFDIVFAVSVAALPLVADVKDEAPRFPKRSAIFQAFRMAGVGSGRFSRSSPLILSRMPLMTVVGDELSSVSCFSALFSFCRACANDCKALAADCSSRIAKAPNTSVI